MQIHGFYTVFLFLFFSLVTGISAAGSDKEEDSPKLTTKVAASSATTQKGLLLGKPSSLKVSEAKKGLASRLLKGVLKDQLNIVPEMSKNYVFFLSEPGNLLENICNGGSHVAFVIATWRAEPAKPKNGLGTQWPTFEATKNELGVWRYDPKLGYKLATHDDDDFSDSVAVDSLKKKEQWVALGKSGLNKTFKELTEFLQTESADYLEKGRNKEYDYYKRNCGDYVSALLPMVQVEHPQMSEIVHSPMKRSEMTFIA